MNRRTRTGHEEQNVLLTQNLEPKNHEKKISTSKIFQQNISISKAQIVIFMLESIFATNVDNLRDHTCTEAIKC